MPTLAKSKTQKLLLDTHVWIWAETNGKKRISAGFGHYVEACQKSSSLLLSPISFWELGMLTQKGRLRLSMDCLDWITQATNVTGLRIMPITPRIAVLSTRLPIHGDPADRILVATAIEHNAIFATADEKLIAYCEGNSIPYRDPRSR